MLYNRIKRRHRFDSPGGCAERAWIIKKSQLRRALGLLTDVHISRKEIDLKSPHSFHSSFSYLYEERGENVWRRDREQSINTGAEYRTRKLCDSIYHFWQFTGPNVVLLNDQKLI